MGAYREQLLKERHEIREEERPSSFLLLFKVRFLICLFLFGIFAYLYLTGNTIFQVTADQVVELVTDDSFSDELQARMEKMGL